MVAKNDDNLYGAHQEYPVREDSVMQTISQIFLYSNGYNVGYFYVVTFFLLFELNCFVCTSDLVHDAKAIHRLC